jgi:hypothetical protein
MLTSGLFPDKAMSLCRPAETSVETQGQGL